MDFSDDHSSSVANVRNLTTRYIPPQYHIGFDDLFQTVYVFGENEVVTDCYVDKEHDEDGDLIYTPSPLFEVWLDEHQHCKHMEELGCQQQIIKERKDA